jgi:hypothetical protein
MIRSVAVGVVGVGWYHVETLASAVPFVVLGTSLLLLLLVILHIIFDR